VNYRGIHIGKQPPPAADYWTAHRLGRIIAHEVGLGGAIPDEDTIWNPGFEKFASLALAEVDVALPLWRYKGPMEGVRERLLKLRRIASRLQGPLRIAEATCRGEDYVRFEDLVRFKRGNIPPRDPEDVRVPVADALQNGDNGDELLDEACIS